MVPEYVSGGNKYEGGLFNPKSIINEDALLLQVDVI